MLWILFSYVRENKFLYTCIKKLIKYFFKTHDYFQNIIINIMFLLNKFLFYMQNTQCLHRTCCRLYTFYLHKHNLC